MLFKTLKHKTLPDTYGHISEVDGNLEILHSVIPNLQPMTATMELMREIFKDELELLKQMPDFDLVKVWISKPLSEAIKPEEYDLFEKLLNPE